MPENGGLSGETKIGITKKHEEPFGGDEYVRYLGRGANFTNAYTSENLPNCKVLNMCTLLYIVYNLISMLFKK